MKRQIKKTGLLGLLLFMSIMAFADSESFIGFKIDLTNGNLLTSEEITNKATVSFGIAVAADGTGSRSSRCRGDDWGQIPLQRARMEQLHRHRSCPRTGENHFRHVCMGR